MRNRGLIDAVRCQGIVDVGDGDDPSRQRNRFTGQSGRVSGSVVSFMMRDSDVPSHSQEIRLRVVLESRFQDFGALLRMRLYYLKLFPGQPPGFQQDGIVDRYLADIVQGTGHIEQTEKLAVNLLSIFRLAAQPFS